MKIEITIPVLNEEETLEKQVYKILNFFEANNLDDFSLVIADNGSTDHTKDISKNIIKNTAKVRFISVGKKGVGLALKSSWKDSTADVVGYMDLDLATDINHLLAIKNIFENSDINIINGSRLMKDSKVVNRTLLREITSRGFNFILKVLLNTKISDGMCGFKFFRKKCVDKLLSTNIEINEWFFSTEILIKSEWLGIHITELPVRWTDDRKSKVKIIPLSSNYLKNMFRLRKEKKDWINKWKKLM